MKSFRVTRTIDAPVERVFRAITDPEQFSRAVPDIVKVEHLSGARSGVGTRFRETRLMNGREMATELEITEHVENERVRMVADSHGTVWDSVFRVRKAPGGATELSLTMDARPHTLAATIMTPLIKGVIQKALVKDMEAMKAFCEGRPRSSGEASG